VKGLSKYVAEGALINRRLMMHNTFLLAGPSTDPAKVKFGEPLFYPDAGRTEAALINAQ
jgi:ABC-type tungstate transport system permease subunit